MCVLAGVHTAAMRPSNRVIGKPASLGRGWPGDSPVLRSMAVHTVNPQEEPGRHLGLMVETEESTPRCRNQAAHPAPEADGSCGRRGPPTERHTGPSTELRRPQCHTHMHRKMGQKQGREPGLTGSSCLSAQVLMIVLTASKKSHGATWRQVMSLMKLQVFHGCFSVTWREQVNCTPLEVHSHFHTAPHPALPLAADIPEIQCAHWRRFQKIKCVTKYAGTPPWTLSSHF